MFAVRDLPARPSVDSLRKPAKKLARDAAAENGEAIARVHVQLPRATLPLSNRDAQLVIARTTTLPTIRNAQTWVGDP